MEVKKVKTILVIENLHFGSNKLIFLFCFIFISVFGYTQNEEGIPTLPEISTLKEGIKYRKNFNNKYFSILLQDTSSSYFNRVPRSYLSGDIYDTKRLTPFIINEITLKKVHDYYKHNDTLKTKKYIQLYIGCIDYVNGDSCIVVQYLKRKEYLYFKSSYNRVLDLFYRPNMKIAIFKIKENELSLINTPIWFEEKTKARH
jgi:hypothetical protein